MIYFDNASSKLYNKSLLTDIINKESDSLYYSNPHSLNKTSISTTQKINEIRTKVLNYTNASSDIYDCIFTSGTTHGLKIVGEYFNWTNKNNFIYTIDNHTSVIGIREYALKKGSTVKVVDFNNDDKLETIISFTNNNDNDNNEKINSDNINFDINDTNDNTNDINNNCVNLFIMPAESNFSGKLYDRKLINEVKKEFGETIFLYDVAKYISTNELDMSDNLIDIVPISFYKIFGFPTGLGALIVKKSISKYLNKTYYGGGTIIVNSSYNNYHVKNNNFVERFEDGSPNYINIIYLEKFLDNKYINTVKIKIITYYFLQKISDLKYQNGKHVFEIYDLNAELNFKEFCKKHGTIVSFNLLKSNEDYIGYKQVELLLNENNISVRTGCLCNSGACMKNLKFTPDNIKHNFELGHDCNNFIEIIDNKITGVIRASFCEKNTLDEIDYFIKVIQQNYMND
jgi:molybdenum cofactor sulfurtransferase